MTLIDVVRAETGGSLRGLLLASNLAGIANVAIMNVVVTAISGGEDARGAQAFARYLLLLIVYIVCTRRANNTLQRSVESALHKIKVRVADRVARTELDALERVRAAEVCDRINENTKVIIDRITGISALLQSIFLLLFTALYIAWLSPPAFALVALLCVVGTLMFINIRKDFIGTMMQSAALRVTFLDRLADLLAGFKEMKFSRRASREIRADIIQAADRLRGVTIRSNDLFNDGTVLGEGVVFVLFGAVVYTLHTYVDVGADALAQLVAVIMFVSRPFMGVAGGIMPYIRSNMALAQISALEDKLEAAVDDLSSEPPLDPWSGRIAPIEVHALEYTHRVDDGGRPFSIGPIDLTLRPGEVVFIVGGNGSGKSTFLKVLTGLYPPRAGAIHVGDVAVNRRNVAAYRDMISAIFSDFHLFARLYGVPEADDAAVRGLLARMKLTGKTTVSDRTFSRIDLSTGQKKRLAMIVALLEDRPFCVFDEWAADQDPEFRRYFYEDLLPSLRREGKIVLVVSHDDRYFALADRVLTMDTGKIRDIVAHTAGPA